jgi:flagellar biosynthesis protein FlhF
MDIKTFRASTMQEALALVRRELGPSAAVLQTREVGTSPLVRWIPGMRKIEVTASADVNVPSRFAPRPGMPRRETPPVEAPRPAAHSAPEEDVKAQIEQLQSLVADLCRRTQSSERKELPDGLFQLYTQLIDAEFTEEAARELMDRVRSEVDPRDLADAHALRGRVAQLIEQDIAVAGTIQLIPGQRKTVALVGPTGVGKTTTIAKLAANYRLREKRRVGLITVDTYRIAAVEQLRTYADIIDLPMYVASTPREMREAVQQLKGFDLVLMDTAGRSPQDEIKLQELRSFLGEAQADEVLLVLSSLSSASALRRTAEQFSAVGATGLILTKLDEAPGLGNLLPLLKASRLPLSYLTNGQNVPDDIEAAESKRLAKLILGLDSPTRR